MRKSPQRQPTRQLRQAAASPVDRQAADATRSKARNAAAPISTPQRRRDGGRHRRRDENPLRRAHDSRPPPTRCRREAFCRSRRSRGEKQNHQLHDPRRNTRQHGTHLRRKPRREARRRVPKRDGSFRTSHLKRKPHHQGNQRPPAPKTSLTSPTPNTAASPHAVRPAPYLTTDPNDSKTPTQTQAERRACRHAAETAPPSYPTRQKPPRGEPPPPTPP